MQVDDVRAELAGFWQSWLERTLAALLACGPAGTSAQYLALNQLQRLLCFLPAAVPDAGKPEPSLHSPCGSVAQLSALLRCQSRLQGGGGAATAAILLREQLQQALLKLAQACRHSDWTLETCVAGGLARQCRMLTLLAAFADDPGLAAQLAALEAQLLLWHAAAVRPSAQQQLQVQKQVLALAQGRLELATVLQVQVQPLAAGGVPLPSAAESNELLQLALALQPAQLPAAEASESLLFASYRLAWVLHALGRYLLADTGLLAYQLLVQHWQWRLPLQTPVQALLAAWVLYATRQNGQAEGPEELQPLLALLGPALACWPGKRVATRSGMDASIRDAGLAEGLLPSAAEPGLPDLRQLPLQLATSLCALLQAEASWFADRCSWQACSRLLQEELRLLEQGAAALRLAALEEFCSLLLGLHAQLAAELPQGDWPAALLWQAHDELVGLLDRAALWLEPLPAFTTLVALRDCLQQGEERCAAVLRAAQASPSQRLAAALALFCQRAGHLLGRQVRIRLQAGSAIPDLLEPELLRILQEILRWLLLQHESSSEQRRSLRLPLATALEVTLQVQDGPACELTVVEAGARGLPGAKALQRLQRSLGPAAEALCCEELPRQGRRVQCRLSAASLQRAWEQRYRG